MKRHTRIYIKYFNIGQDDYAPCELGCGRRAVDIHHIDSRGSGGDPTGKKDVIENLMGLCRKCHEKFGDKVEYFDYLVKRHKEYMEAFGSNQ
jgi:5-methylcytosine-specific restriction endonuclease McrA